MKFWYEVVEKMDFFLEWMLGGWALGYGRYYGGLLNVLMEFFGGFRIRKEHDKMCRYMLTEYDMVSMSLLFDFKRYLVTKTVKKLVNN